jgi:hypothetical protein
MNPRSFHFNAVPSPQIRRARTGVETWGSNICRTGATCLTGDIGRDGRSDVLDIIRGGATSFARSLP